MGIARTFLHCSDAGMLVVLLSVLLVTLEQTQGSETRVQGDTSAVGQSDTSRSEGSEAMVEISGGGAKSRGHSCNCIRQRNDLVNLSCPCQSPPKSTRKSNRRPLKKSEIKECLRKGIRHVAKCRKLKPDGPVFGIPI
ncbi:hypothetical protein AALO_G00174050 [Alosa alosa]|uniref:Secreted protein n=1 Tax=Alosa alosa TaxID=278164 RepID=A0AAV6G8M0_9TELE|nr:hypothetical protein AALO_G00174050 [Alosa alosa]